VNVRAPLAGVLCVVLATPAPGAAPRYAWAREDGSVHLAITTLRVVGTLRQGAEAVPGATLEVSADEDFTLKLHTDEEARFRAVVPRPARYMVVAHLPDQRRQVVLWNLADARPGEELQRDIVVTPRWLKGKVVNQAGAPLPTARVTYRARDVARGEEVMGEAAVRQDGSFAVPLEEQKGLELHVGGVDGFLPASFLWPSSPPEEVTVVLEEGVDVRGVVVDGAGRPQQATVAVVADLFETGGPRTPASGDGTFRFTTPRNATVVAWSSDGVAWAHAQEKLELRLAPRGEPARVALAGAEEKELARSRLALTHVDGRQVPFWLLVNLQRERGVRPLVDGAGTVVLPGLPSAQYRLLLRTRGGVLWTAPVVLPGTGVLHLVPAQP